jgi:hypothetical protein
MDPAFLPETTCQLRFVSWPFGSADTAPVIRICPVRGASAERDRARYTGARVRAFLAAYRKL